MATVEVTHLTGDRYRITTRGHTVIVDQPDDAGHEAGPSPVELFVMSLAGCTAHYATGYLRSCNLSADGLRVTCRWSMRTDPSRVGRVLLTVNAPTSLSATDRDGLLAAVDHCTVHNTLLQPPRLDVRLKTHKGPANGDQQTGATERSTADSGSSRTRASPIANQRT